MSKKRGVSTDFVEPDLPITPMLDMSFQLLSFFIMTFRVAPTEGQIAMALPPAQEGGPSTSIPDITAEQPKKWVVRIAANDSGQIASMIFREEGSADDGGENIGTDVNVYLKKVKALYEVEKKRIEGAQAKGTKIPPPKLTLEIADKLLQEYVIALFDAGVQAGFTDIAPVPIDKTKR